MIPEVKIKSDFAAQIAEDLLIELDEYIPIVVDEDSEYYGHKRIHKHQILPPCLSCTTLKYGEYDWYTYDHATGWFTSKTNRLED